MEQTGERKAQQTTAKMGFEKKTAAALSPCTPLPAVEVGCVPSPPTEDVFHDCADHDVHWN
eukprot:5686579-Prorocentrum_lima.AAC.1